MSCSSHPGAGADPDGLQRLLTALRGQRPRVAVALVLADIPDHAEAARWQLTIDADGTLRIPALNVELIAQQIPADEAAQLTRMLAVAATTEDRPTPATYGGRPWNGHADAAGSLPPEVTAGMTVAAADEPVRRGTGDTPVPQLDEFAPRVATSVLPVCRQTSLDRLATPGAGVDALAPPVTDEIRGQVESADLTLDADLADWYDQG